MLHVTIGGWSSDCDDNNLAAQEVPPASLQQCRLITVNRLDLDYATLQADGYCMGAIVCAKF